MTPQFRSKVERFGPRMMADLGATALQVAGAFGNFAVETDQFRTLQERGYQGKKDRQGRQLGGFGWAQWTGRSSKNRRRQDFEDWCVAQGIDPAEDEANYGFLLHEATGTERAAIRAWKQTTTLDRATEVFCLKYERPGAPHLEKRKALALEALRVLEAVTGTKPAPVPVVPVAAPVVPAPTSKPSAIGGFLNRILGRADAAAPAAAPLPAEITKGDPAVYRVQGALIARGYAEVGEQDGDIGGPGSKTRAAIRAAQEANGLPITGEMDPTFLAALPSMPARQPAAVREKTVKQLVAEGSTPAKAAVDMGFLGRMLGLGGIVGGVQQTGLLDSLRRTADTPNDTLGSVQGVVTSVIGVGQFVASYWWIILVGLGLWGALAASERALRIRALYRQGTITRASA